jgi:hypothetical protein
MAESRRVWRRQRYWVGWVLAAWLGSASLYGLVAIPLAAAGSKHTPLAVGIAVGVFLGALYGVIGFIFYRRLSRPRLVADCGGLSVRNPFHEYAIPWSSIEGLSATDQELTIIRFDADPVNVHAVRSKNPSRLPSTVAATLESLRTRAVRADRVPDESLALGGDDVGRERPVGWGVDQGLDDVGRRFSINTESAMTFVGAVDRLGIPARGRYGRDVPFVLFAFEDTLILAKLHSARFLNTWGFRPSNRDQSTVREFLDSKTVTPESVMLRWPNADTIATTDIRKARLTRTLMRVGDCGRKLTLELEGWGGPAPLRAGIFRDFYVGRRSRESLQRVLTSVLGERFQSS